MAATVVMSVATARMTRGATEMKLEVPASENNTPVVVAALKRHTSVSSSEEAPVLVAAMKKHASITSSEEVPALVLVLAAVRKHNIGDHRDRANPLQAWQTAM